MNIFKKLLKQRPKVEVTEDHIDLEITKEYWWVVMCKKCRQPVGFSKGKFAQGTVMSAKDVRRTKHLDSSVPHIDGETLICNCGSYVFVNARREKRTDSWKYMNGQPVRKRWDL
jgi:hypothetical protein